MIQNNDRSWWFGASETNFIVTANRSSDRWATFWKVKTGEIEPPFKGNIYTRAGNRYEHPILYAIDPGMVVDGQIIMENYRLRVNFDGYKDGLIREVKTHKSVNPYSLSDEHWMQVQVEMYAYQMKCKEWFLPPFEGLEIISYALNPEEYHCALDEIVIDEARILHHPVKYDAHWIKSEYLPQLKSCSP